MSDDEDVELAILRTNYFARQAPYSERLEMSKTDYYQELLRYSLCNLMLYPYHLCSDFPDDVLAAPQVYYNEMVVRLIVHGLPYDELPVFCAADIAQTIGVDRDEYERRFAIVNRGFNLRNLFTRVDICARRLTEFKKLVMPDRDWTHYQLIRRESTDIDLVTQHDLIDFFRTDGLVPVSVIENDRARCFYAAQHLVPMIRVEREAKLRRVREWNEHSESDLLYERVLTAILNMFEKAAVARDVVETLASEFTDDEILNGISLLVRLGVFDQRRTVLDHHVRTAVILKPEFIQVLSRSSDSFRELLNNGVVECMTLKSHPFPVCSEACRVMSLLVDSIGNPANVAFCDIRYLWRNDNLRNVVMTRLNYDVVVMASGQYPKLWRTPVIGTPCDSTNAFLWPCFIQTKSHSMDWRVYRKGESLSHLKTHFRKYQLVRLYTPNESRICSLSEAQTHVANSPVAVVGCPSDKTEFIPFPNTEKLDVGDDFLLSETFGYAECVRDGNKLAVVNITYGIPVDAYQICNSVVDAAANLSAPLTKARLDILRPRLGRLADQFLGFCRQHL